MHKTKPHAQKKDTRIKVLPPSLSGKLGGIQLICVVKIYRALKDIKIAFYFPQFIQELIKCC